MKRSSIEQFATVKEDTASLFNEQLNAEILRLKDFNPVVKISESIPYYAHVKYYISSETPETISEEYEMVGVRFVCSQCPYYKPTLKRDGAADKRSNRGECDIKSVIVQGRTPACDELYRLISERSVKLCFAE